MIKLLYGRYQNSRDKIEGIAKKRTTKTTRKAIEERRGREKGSSPRSIMPLERSKYLSSR